MPLKLITAKQLAASIGGDVTARVILRWARKKVIPCIRINKRVVKFNMDAVRKKLEPLGK